MAVDLRTHEGLALRRFLATPEGQRAAKLSLYRREPERFFREQLKVKTKPPEPEIKPLYPLKPAQRIMLRAMEEQRRQYGFVRLICLKARQMGSCLSPDTRVLTADLCWKPISELKLGERIISVDEEPPGGRGAARKMQTAEVQAIREIIELAFKITLEDGRTITATGNHRFLCRLRGATDNKWRSVKRMRVGDEIRYIAQPWGESRYEDGWFGGFIDGEGCLRVKNRAGIELSVSQVENDALDRARNYLSSNGYNNREERDERCGKKSKLGHKTVIKLVMGRANELFRLIGQCRSSRFIGQEWWVEKELPGKKSGVGLSTILKIECLTRQKMIDLQTSTKTYIAEGFVSHNSTVCLAHNFHATAIQHNTNALTVANDRETAENLFSTIKLFYEQMSPEFRPAFRYSNKRELTFEDKENPENSLHSSIAVAWASKTSVGVSRTLSILHLSEVAFYKWAEIAISNVVGSIQLEAGTSIIMESTAYFAGSYFKKMCLRAQAGDPPWKFIFLPWTIVPEYRIALAPGERLTLTKDEHYLAKEHGVSLDQMKWRRFKIAEFKGDEMFFKERFPLTVDEAWIVIGSCVFPNQALRKLEKFVKPPVRRCEIIPERRTVVDVEDGPLWIWEEPKEGAEYDLAADVALGTGEDSSPPDTEEDAAEKRKRDEQLTFSAIQVVRRGTLEQVAEWRGRPEPYRLAQIAETLGYYYNTAQIAVEVRGIGLATSDALSKLRLYPNIYRWRYRDRIGTSLTKSLGWDTGFKSKQILVAFALHTMMVREEDNPLIHSERLLEELRTFVRYPNDTYEAAAGFLDDLVMSWCIALVTSNDEDFSRFAAAEQHQTKEIANIFYPPDHTPPYPPEADPAYCAVDADFRSPFAVSEVDGW